MSERLDLSTQNGAHALLARMAGSWKGTSKLWFEPDQLAEETPISGTLRLVLDGMFLLHEYRGMITGKPHEGIAVIGYFLGENRWMTAWIDSFHNGTRIMCSHGSAGADPKVPDVLGNYPGPPGPDWGWRTAFDLKSNDHLMITHYNIDPEGNEATAVEIDYRRSK